MEIVAWHWQLCQMSNTTVLILVSVFLKYFINWFIKRHKVVTSETPFLPRDGRNHLRYSLQPPMEGWPGWVAWMNTGMAKVVTNPSTNRTRHSLTSLMWRTPLPLRQTSYSMFVVLGLPSHRGWWRDWVVAGEGEDDERRVCRDRLCPAITHNDRHRQRRPGPIAEQKVSLDPAVTSVHRVTYYSGRPWNF